MFPSECFPSRRSFLKTSAALATGFSGLPLLGQPPDSQESDTIVGPRKGYSPEIGTALFDDGIHTLFKSSCQQKVSHSRTSIFSSMTTLTASALCSCTWLPSRLSSSSILLMASNGTLGPTVSNKSGMCPVVLANPLLFDAVGPSVPFDAIKSI